MSLQWTLIQNHSATHAPELDVGLVVFNGERAFSMGGGGAQGLFLGGAEIIARTVVCGTPKRVTAGTQIIPFMGQGSN